MRPRKSLFIFTVLLIVTAYGCGRKADLTGRWEGPLDVGPAVGILGKPAETTFHIVMTIGKEGERLKATLVSIPDSPVPIAAGSIVFKDGTLIAAFGKRHETFEGKLNSEGTELSGSIKQAPYDIPLVLKKTSGS